MIEIISCSLAGYIDRLRPLVDAALDHYTLLPPDCPPRLREAMRYSLLAPGKRFRPLLVLMAAEACGAEIEQSATAGLSGSAGNGASPETRVDKPPVAPTSSVAPVQLGTHMAAAAAVEMVHAYSLIHDDLPAMDDDDLRRGRPTCHKQFDEATAILAGDALLALAFQTLAEMPAEAGVAARCCAVLARAAGPCRLVGGQADDMAGVAETTSSSTADQLPRLEAIHARKTGALISAALEMGALTAGAGEVQLEALREYGRRLGLAFQITDDLLDAGGDAAALGKRVGKDAEQGKLTFPGLLGAEESRVWAERLIGEAREALAPLGNAAEALSLLAQYVLERNR